MLHAVMKNVRLFVALAMHVLSLIQNFCAFHWSIKPEDQWSYKRSPEYWPGVNTTRAANYKSVVRSG